jgi:hypothetical protein
MLIQSRLSINLDGVEIQRVTCQRSCDSGCDSARYLSCLPVCENELACLPAFPERVERFGIAPSVEFIELAVLMPKLTVQMLTGQVPGELDCFTSGPHSVRAVSNRVPDQICASESATCARVDELCQAKVDKVKIVSIAILVLSICELSASLGSSVRVGPVYGPNPIKNSVECDAVFGRLCALFVYQLSAGCGGR